MNAKSAMVRMFEDAGFRLVRCKNHAVWRCPCGHRQVVSTRTPSDRKALDNARREIARTLQCCCPTKEIA